MKDLIDMKLVNEKGKALQCKAVEPSALGLLSEERIRILQLLAEKPYYPAELARELDMPTQTVYYHIRRLERAGFLEFTEYEERQGGIAKRYACPTESVAVVINSKGWKAMISSKKTAPKLIAPFVKNGFFNGRMIVGSPDPHGRYRARGSELSVLELAMLLGQYSTFEFPLYVLDTQLKAKDKKQNLILAGGPKVNTLVEEINDKLPIRFDKKNFEVYSTLSKKHYMENIGVVELVDNPFSKRSKILVVGGLNHHGTRAAVLALIEKMKELEKGNKHTPAVLAKVVEGFDENGDGMVDAVEILE